LEYHRARYDDGPRGTFELAKDVAAFANHVGGLIILWIAEDDQGRAAQPGEAQRAARYSLIVGDPSGSSRLSAEEPSDRLGRADWPALTGTRGATDYHNHSALKTCGKKVRSRSTFPDSEHWTMQPHSYTVNAAAKVSLLGLRRSASWLLTVV
jgi:hypothetical protein